MILKYHCVFGGPMRLDLEERFGARVEIEALEFVDALPIEWRLVSDALADFAWRPGMPERKTFAFHDLQVPSGNGTRGTKGCGLWLETRGIGSCLVLVWPREGTYSERSSALVSLQARVILPCARPERTLRSELHSLFRLGCPHHLHQHLAGFVGALDFAKEVDACALHSFFGLQPKVEAKPVYSSHRCFGRSQACVNPG